MPEANDLEAFYQAYYASLWAFLARASGDPALAEDLAQEAFLRLLGSRAEHWPWATRRPYLYRIGLNLLRDRQRRDWREAPLEAVAEPAAPAPGLS
ncbi:MAG TPA: sigma factor, partial [Thermoanaerobaculia bacterium]|nr:sigma factor [Thermoanaerobaculia bacterium]